MRSQLLAYGVALSCFLFVVKIQHSEATCDTVLVWEGVPEADYDRRFASINEPDGRPLGFNRSVIPYSGDNQPNPCIRVENTMDRRIEVMAQAVTGSSNICTDSSDGNRVCGSSLYVCEQAATGNDATYEFYCLGDSCEVNAFPFFFRFTVSPPPSEIDPELWCDARDTSEYPQSLTPALPPGRTIPPRRTTPTSGATISRGINFFVLATVSLFAMASWLNVL